MKNTGNLSTKVIVITILSISQNTGNLGNQGNHGNNTINVNFSTRVTVINKSIYIDRKKTSNLGNQINMVIRKSLITLVPR